MLCGVDAFLVIFDKEKQSLTQLSSDPDFDYRVVSHMLQRYNREQFKCSMFTNSNYKDFLNDKEDEQAADDDRQESLEEETQPNAAKKIQKKNYFKEYLKERQEYLDTIKDPGFYQGEKPLEDLLKKFIIPDKQGTKYQERYRAAQQMKYT